MIGIIGAGSFGTTLTKVISRNSSVLVYARQESLVHEINTLHTSNGYPLRTNVKATTNLSDVATQCELLFAVVPSSSFRGMMKDLNRFLTPAHVMIQCTKGLDVKLGPNEDIMKAKITRDKVYTMTDVIKQESNVIRVGCLSGPNLAKEILNGQPAATVIASEYDEVIQKGQKALGSKKFFAFGSYDLRAAEIAGAFKNIIALASGILAGMGMGKNMQSLLITRGLREMVYFGVAMGTSNTAYLGVAGIGDLIATATSEDSRNYTFGKRFASGESLNHILSTTAEVVEGVRTLNIIYQLATHEKLNLPIVHVLYKVVFEGFDMRRGLDFLMDDEYAVDVDYL
ncbi:MAG: NAD(P)H-dependent glycerol-3-phosphate dehydrogenase [Saprospiraceae bacterium]